MSPLLTIVPKAPLSVESAALVHVQEVARAAFVTFKCAKEEVKTAKRYAANCVTNNETSALRWAMDAGDAAIALEQFAPARGKQKFLKESADAPLSTIKLCIKLAQGRARIESEMANISQMSIRAAIRLLAPKSENKTKKSSLVSAWNKASAEDQCHFVVIVKPAAIVAVVGAEAFWDSLTERQRVEFNGLSIKWEISQEAGAEAAQ